MGLLDKFKKKKQPQFNQMYGPNPYMGYQQHNPNLQNPYGMGPQFQQRPPYPSPQPSQYPYQQNYYPTSQQPLTPQQVYYQHPVAQQPQLQYNQNKLLQPVPFQNQPVIQSHQSGVHQQQSTAQSQYPMTGQPPEKKEAASPGFFSRIFDSKSQKISGELPVPAEMLFTAGRSKLVVYSAKDQTFQRYRLEDLKHKQEGRFVEAATARPSSTRCGTPGRSPSACWPAARVIAGALASSSRPSDRSKRISRATWRRCPDRTRGRGPWSSR